MATPFYEQYTARGSPLSTFCNKLTIDSILFMVYTTINSMPNTAYSLTTRRKPVAVEGDSRVDRLRT